MEPRYRLVLLDADRTLFDFDLAQAHALEAAAAPVLERAGLPCTQEVLLRYRAVSEGLWGRYERGEVTQAFLQTERFRQLFAELGAPGDAAEANRRYLDRLGEEDALLDGAEELCRTLAPFCHLAIVTNGISRSQRRRLEKSALRPYIREIFISEDLGVQKPQKEFFDRVFAQLPSFSRAETVILGDSLSSDIAGGRAAGIDACWFCPAGGPQPDPAPAYTIRRLLDFIPIVLPGE